MWCPVTPTRRKPTFPERADLAIQALNSIIAAKEKDDSLEPYAIAFAYLGTIGWLHSQSRDGVAAEAAASWRDGTRPYAGVSFIAAEYERQIHVRKGREFHQHRVEEVAGLMKQGYDLDEIAQRMDNGPYSTVYVKRFVTSARAQGLA